MTDCLEVWYRLQSNIFVGTEDIRIQLPDEPKMFNKVSNAFQYIYYEGRIKHQKLWRLCCTEHCLETFQDLTRNLIWKMSKRLVWIPQLKERLFYFQDPI